MKMKWFKVEAEWQREEDEDAKERAIIAKREKETEERIAKDPKLQKEMADFKSGIEGGDN